MTPENKKFILKKLIPFILREQGRGFIMADWIMPAIDKKFRNPDLKKEIKSPACGTAACIGGSIEILSTKAGERTQFSLETSRYIGLTHDEGRGLFFGWTEHPERGEDDNLYGWPPKSVTEFVKAKTPLGKAKVAVALLKEVVRTEGKCLHRN